MSKYNFNRSLADTARWRCLVPHCPFRSDALTRDSFELDQAAHLAESPGHERLVRIGYQLPSAVYDLVALLASGVSTLDVSRRTIVVAVREGVVTETEHGLARTPLGRALTPHAVERRPACRREGG